MAKFNASRVRLKIGSVAIEDLENCELNIDAETIDVTTMESNGWSEFLHGVKNWTMTGSGIVDFGATEGVDEIADDIIAGAIGSVEFTTTQTGDTKFSGSALYTNLKIGAEVEGKCTFSFSLQGTGVLTKGTQA
ncbi:MAG: phage tail tube protein [Cyclobacteriaceae bacterium]